MQKTKKKLSWEEKIQKRHESNKKIIERLGEIADAFPDFRFWQIIYFLGYETTPDRFYEESCDTLESIENFLEGQKKK